MAFVVYYIRRRRPMFFKRQSAEDRDIEKVIEHHGSFAPKRFSYSEVKRMTDSFKDKLGQGGFGAVYRGKLPGGALVAVKLLNSAKGSGEEFINEVVSISRTAHVNIVSLLGFCFECEKRALVYEYMSNGSLDGYIKCHLSPTTTESRLEWDNLYRIAIGIAKGLEYLHQGCSTRILHLDIKPQNILLDNEFHPKISDFGLSKLCLGRESVISSLRARGTIGYIAPEFFSRNYGVSHKSDVYSYGMMLMDMVGGSENLEAEADHSSEVYFHDRVYRLVEQGRGVEHKEPLAAKDKEAEIARKMALVAVWCIQTDPAHRPSISKAIEMLEGSMEALPIPPKPFFFSTAGSSSDSSSTSASL